MRIAMVGAGYVGLVSGACLADFGHDVTCVDQDTGRIEMLRHGDMPIFEPGLEELVAANVAGGRLHFTTDLAASVAAAEVVFIAVGTPAHGGDGDVDLSFVYTAAEAVARAARGGKLIVTKSTVPVGTGDEVERIVRANCPDGECTVVSNPEFLREGTAIAEFVQPDRVVVGIEDGRAREPMLKVYRSLHARGVPIQFTTRRTAELMKYAGNAFLAMKISFINEIADLCEVTGVDVLELAQGIGLDRRIAPGFLRPGPGYGGSCLPKDTAALANLARQRGRPVRLVETAIAVNEQRKRDMSRRVIAALGGSVQGKTIAILGLTFKPDTDDMREAPSVPAIAGLLDAGARVRVFDPEGMDTARALLGAVEYAVDAYDAAAGADGVVLVTEWTQLRSLDLGRLRRAMATPNLIDLRNVYRRQDAEAAGFAYFGIGRGS